jgi:hypothetical protein
VQIQILLLFLILSLPGAKPASGVNDAQTSPRIKRRLPDLTTQKVEAQSTRDRLESFMDKLSMWQLMHGLEVGLNSPKAQNKVKKDERDWMQIFCEELVEKQYVVLRPSFQLHNELHSEKGSNRNAPTCVVCYDPKYSAVPHSLTLPRLLRALHPLRLPRRSMSIINKRENERILSFPTLVAASHHPL